jgi:hypothetical protein
MARSRASATARSRAAQLANRIRRALLCATIAFSLSCTGTAPRPSEPEGPSSVQGEGERAFLVGTRLAQFPEAIPGDAVLQGRELAVQIEGRGRPTGRLGIAALQHEGGAHDWEAMYPLLAFGGELHEVTLERLELARMRRHPKQPEQPAVVVHGAVETGERRLRVRRVLQLADVPGALHVTTRVAVERGAVPRDLTVVERVGWGGGTPVAPLAGPLLHDTPAEAEWVGRAMSGRAVVVGSPAGSSRIVGRQSDHGRADLLRYTDVFLPTRALARDRFQADSVLVTSLAGLGDAARRFGWARGKPFAEATVMLTVAPPDAEVRLLDAQTGQLVSSARPDADLRAILPIALAAERRSLLLVAAARGREASPRVPLRGPPYAPVTLTIPAGSRLEVVAEHAASGEPIPVRIRVLPRQGTPDPELGPDWAASGAIDTVIAPAGVASIPLPTGYYRVIVTHGPEWSVHDELVELGVRDSTHVYARLEHVVDPGPWVACEFHVHAMPSPDSQVALGDRVASLVAEGIAFAVPTDHNHVTDYSKAIEAQPLQGLASVPGVEVTTVDPALGHFNAFPYPLDPDLPNNGAPEFTNVQPAALFAGLHALDPDLVVQVNHPRLEGGIGYFDAVGYDPRSGRGGELYSDDYDSLEVWNGFDLARREQVDRVFGDWLAMLARGRRVAATGSSDSHTIRSEMAGYPRTYVRTKIAGVADARALVRALRQGRAFVTSGPFLNVKVDGKGPGEEVVLTSDAIEVDVHVQAASWMQVNALRVYLGDKLVHRSTLGPPTAVRFAGLANRYERTLRLPVSGPSPLVVAIDGDKELAPIVPRGGVRPFAFTNPIWLVDVETAAPAPVDAGALDEAMPVKDAGAAAGAAPHTHGGHSHGHAAPEP